MQKFQKYNKSCLNEKRSKRSDGLWKTPNSEQGVKIIVLMNMYQPRQTAKWKPNFWFPATGHLL